MKWALREKAESNLESSVADETMDQLGKATFDKMCKLFRNAHAIARHSKNHIQTLCGRIPWMTRNGCKLATPTETTSSVQRLSIKLLRHKGMKSKFVSLICDGSTDNSNTEAELAYVRYCHQG